jgi:hypothetical protein
MTRSLFRVPHFRAYAWDDDPTWRRRPRAYVVDLEQRRPRPWQAPRFVIWLLRAAVLAFSVAVGIVAGVLAAVIINVMVGWS